MHRARLRIAVTLAVALPASVGCYGIPGSPKWRVHELASMSPEEQAGQSTKALAQAYAYRGNWDEAGTLRRELERRQAFTAEEWALIDQHQVQIGMSVDAMYASWGPPRKENVSVTRGGRHVQHVYARAYVYSENGTVTSWQQ